MWGNFFNAGPFMPHGGCYLWTESLIALHVLSDACITLAYYSIPFTLVYFVRRRKDLKFRGMFVWFAAFVLACGTTHLLEIWNIWHGDYWLAGILKAITALVSVPTAFLMFKLVPQALALPGTGDLQKAHDELEVRVQQRTAALAESARKLQSEIAERQQAEALLREREAQYRMVMEVSLDAIFILQANRFVLLNPAAVKLFGARQPEEMYGQDIFDYIHPDFHNRFRQRIEQASQQDGSLPLSEQKILRRDGSPVDVETTSSRFQYRQQPALLVEARDISERKRAESMSSWLAAIVENSSDAIIGENLDGIITSWNMGAEKIYGYTPEEIIGASFAQLVPEQQSPEENLILNRIRRDERVESFETTRRTKAGRQIEVAVTASPIKDGNGKVIGVSKLVRDITERRQAEATLKDSEARYRQLFDMAADAVILVDSQTHRYMDVNKATEKLYGYSREEFLQMTPEDVSTEPELTRAHIDAGDVHVPHRWHRKKNGERFAVEINASRIEYRGRPMALVTLRDVTARMQAEAALIASEQFNQATLDALSAHVAVLDETGKILTTNQTWNEFAQANKGDWKAVGAGANFLTLCAEAVVQGDTDAAKSLAGIREVMAGTREVWMHEYPCHTPTEERWFHCRVTRFANGGPVRVVVTHENITERKRTEASHAQLALAVEQSAETIVITDVRGVILYANPAFETSSGYSRAEAVGQNPRVLKSGKHDAAFYRQMWEVLRRGEVWQGHIINRRKDGNLYEEEATISPMRNADGKVVNYVAVKRDVTHEVQLESQFRQSQKMEAIGKLAGGVAHDFNNILAIIQMQTGLLKSVGGMNPAQSEYATEISSTVERAANLTRQLLLFSRKEIFQPRDLDLSEAITNMTKMLRRILGENVQVQLKLAAQPMFVHADTGMMDQVLMNLAVNAHDAMPRGGRLIIETTAVEFDAASAQPGDFVCLTVSDTGAGIPADILPKIFEPFFTTKDVGKGTGLGLATVFGIVQQHHGWINVYSEVGQGTAFKIYLPRLAGMTEAKLAEKMLTPIPTGTETILVVEDELLLRTSVRKALAQLGYRILEAPNGRQAVEVWRAHQTEINLMLTDLVMPDGMNGKDLAQLIHQENPRLKIIYMSGYSAEVVGKDFQLHEGVNFLTKPFSAQRLAQTIRQALNTPT